jgi:hypothetical protein
MVGSLKMITALDYSTRVVQEGDRRCKKSTLNDSAYLTPLRIPLLNPVIVLSFQADHVRCRCTKDPVTNIKLLVEQRNLAGVPTHSLNKILPTSYVYFF